MHHRPVRVLLHPSRPGTPWRRRLDEHAEVDLSCAVVVAECLALITRRRIEVVLVDAADGSGRDLLRQLQFIDDVPVVAAVGEDDAVRRAELLDAGASVLVHVSVTDIELGAQLRALCPSKGAGTGPIRFHAETMEVEVHGSRIVVTETEWKLLSVLAREPGRHFTATELMEAVWGYTTGPTSTVSVHLHRLRAKLEPDPAEPQLLRTVRGRGYALSDGFPPVDPEQS